MTLPSEISPEQPPAHVKHPEDSGLRLIAIIKIGKGILLLGLGLGLFRLVNSDLSETVLRITVDLRIDPENHFIRLLLEKVANFNPGSLRTYGLISLFYAAELCIEGVGLWLNQAWAKYMLLIATGFFVPEEAYYCITRFTWIRLIILGVNIAFVLYVIWVLRVQHRRKVQSKEHPPSG